MEQISKNEIDEIRSLKVASSICKKYNVNTNGLKLVQDYKERLHLFRNKQTIENYQRDSCTQRIKESIAKFKATRIKVIELLQRASKSIFQELEPELVNIVKAFDEYYLKNLKDYERHLDNMEWPILVAGEVSAGKSSLINLILGHSVLPIGHLHTTTCVCELHYALESSLKSFTWNASDKKLELHQETPIKNISNFTTKMKDIMDSTSKNKNLTNSTKNILRVTGLKPSNVDAKEITLLSTSTEDVHIESDDFAGLKLSNGKFEIYSNFNYLKDGIFLVDSPGIGENSLATEQIINYLSSVCSIIYVINAQNAGGIQEDRLVRLLREEQETKKKEQKIKEKFKSFSPESAIFICNKWDTIPITDRDTVEKSIKQKLKRVWPGFRDSQLILFSSTNASNHFEAGFISDDLKVVHSLIANLVEESLKKKIVDYCGWLHSLLGIVANRHRLIINCSLLTGGIRSSYVGDLKRKIAFAKRIIENQNLHDNIEAVIDDGTTKIADSLFKFLSGSKFERGMKSWCLEDIPIREKVADVKEVINRLINDRFVRLLTLWEEDDGILTRFYHHIRESIDNDYAQVLEVLEGIENTLEIDDFNVNDLRNLRTDSTLTENKSWEKFYASIGIFTGTVGGGAAGAAIGLTIAEGVGAVVIGGVIGSVTGGISIVVSIAVMAAIVRYGYAWSGTDVSKQRNKILNIIKDNISTIIRNIAEENKAKEIAENYANRIKEFVKRMRMQIVKLLRANEVLLNEANQNDYSRSRDAVSQKIRNIDKLRNEIKEVLKLYDSGVQEL